jgi:hypothetical protein
VCVIAVIVAASFASAPFASAAKEQGEAHLKIFKHGDLVVTVPPSWAATSKWGVRRTSPPTMRLTGPGHPLEVLITPLVSEGDPSFNSAEQVHKSANKTGQQMLGDAKEASIELQELTGAKGPAFYYTLTEKETPAGAYEYLTNAFIGVGDLLVTATILHHQKDSAAFQQALNVLRSIDQPDFTGADPLKAPARVETKSKPAAPASPVKPKVPEGLRLYAPDNSWAIVIPGNFARQSLELNSSRTAVRYVAADKDAGLKLTVSIEPASEPGDSGVARAAYWRKMLLEPVEKHDVHTSDDGDKANVTYSTADKQKDMNVFLVHNKLWLNVHLSKANFTAPNDESLFQSFESGLAFLDVPASR